MATFIEHLLHAKKCAKCFLYTILYNNNKLDATEIYTTWRSLTLEG